MELVEFLEREPQVEAANILRELPYHNIDGLLTLEIH